MIKALTLNALAIICQLDTINVGFCSKTAGHVSVSTQQCFPKISRLAGVLTLDCCLGKMLMLIYLFFCFFLIIIVSSFCSSRSCQMLADIPVYICLQIVHCS